MAKKVSVIIPNYNGKDLLYRNLASVINNCPGCEIIVVDDASQDKSVDLLKKKFKQVKLIENKKNLGFAKSINIAVEKSKGELILLLNTDVAPRKNFLDIAVKHFINKDLLAVALADFSHENGKIVKRGRGGVNFRKGFINHFKIESKSGDTLWVSGGSGIFDKKKFLILGGFDSIYTPFYWEDIDLSFRAWRLGWRCIFEPNAIVDHFHEEGAIKKSSSDFFIKTVSYKNQFIFVWKNVDDYFLIIQHLLWQPYHFLKALLKLDFAFFAGFFWALLQLPKLALNYQSAQPASPAKRGELPDYKLNVKEVLTKFER
ncbi:hypothetical protein A3A54_00935 [Candidatus Curtissbacteria bacterium RIFCSPLOWO2_01_FULL_39_62]|nr:MAG: hypothetical protein A3E11_01880 [Candidatus Curtissbacteria bacterium RIFCSPHIGHO2_12_FULL_38_37]OGE01851.1 MAG: hypothetical protein A3A54_00935 [Candidatus Curtissbacteria bacterium RIFCSPLOWO2_01_FULL_39_62]